MRLFFFFILFGFFVFPASAAENEAVPRNSLFFTMQEISQADMSAHKTPPEHEGDIHLGAIVYYGPDDWSLWLQGEKWVPGMEHTDLRVLEVTADHVQLLWRGENGAAQQEFTLKPNESFEIATGKIISPP
jgi:hypothetical protein